MNKSTQHLLQIMKRLRDPSEGCPWDVEQDFQSIAPYTIEEAYEVADAISRNHMDDLKNELGDLLLQVVFHAQMATEGGHFNYDDVVDAICEKMVRRHPHVFAGKTVGSAEAQTIAWEDFKAQERSGDSDTSVLANVPAALPALMRAKKLQKRAARVGFDWGDPEKVVEKIREEILEIEAEALKAANGEPNEMTEEVGDLLFTCVNLARKWGVDPETALRKGNEKFERRFRAMEANFKECGRQMSDLSLDQLEEGWASVKAAESIS